MRASSTRSGRSRARARWSAGLRALATALAAGLCLIAGALGAYAVEPDEVLADPALEARARALSLELRCLVCQNQSIDDSNAPLARDLRLLVRERLTAGDSDAEVKRFVVARYGEFVLLRPPFGWHTALLWLAPALVLLATIAAIAARMRGTRPTRPDPGSLSTEEEARLARLLDRDRT